MAANDGTSRRRILPTFRSPILLTLHEWQFKKEISPFLWWITTLLETVSSTLRPFYLHQILLLYSWEENGIFHILLYSRRLSNFSFLHSLIVSNFSNNTAKRVVNYCLNKKDRRQVRVSIYDKYLIAPYCHNFFFIPTADFVHYYIVFPQFGYHVRFLSTRYS